MSTTESEIASFYANSVIFITGASGFVGKVLVEKLLRSCPDISRIYLLLRSKRGSTSEQRLAAFCESEIFDKLRSAGCPIGKKLVAVEGDISQPKLGISDSQYDQLLEEVTIVFHSAASVRFDDPLK